MSIIDKLPAPFRNVGQLPTLTHCKLFEMRKSLTNSPRRSVLGQFQTVECALESEATKISHSPLFAIS